MLFATGIVAQTYNYCNPHAYYECSGSVIFWFDSCGNKQDLKQDCATLGLACKYGQCAQAEPQYTKHYKTACHNNSLYWSDSKGVIQDIYKSCNDSNPCTLDECSVNKCLNALKCDGSTCASGAAEYNSYCAQNSANNSGNQNNANANVPANLSVSFFAKKDASATQWNKTIEMAPNGDIYFLVAISNNSDVEVSNISVKANIPSEIGLLGNLKINDIATSGDIVSGVDIGSLPSKSSKTITFEGKTQAFTSQGEQQATITITAIGAQQSDTLTINFNPNQPVDAAAAVSASQTSSSGGFVGFLKRWYIWILIGIALAILFIIVFRRLSKES